MMRLAAGAATAGVAYHVGKSRAEQDADNKQASAAYAATTEVQPSPTPTMPAGGGAADPIAELERLAQLHSSGVLSDDEFAAAKATVLGS
jgi:hypothetical protein